MMLKEIFTTHILELLLISISAYVAAKTYKTRNSNNVTKAFSAFATANMIFQTLDFIMALNRSGICFNGHATGGIIYVTTLIAMAGTGYHWLIYVENAIGAETFESKKNVFLWSIPLIVFSAMCIVSVKTGWIFTFNAEGKYVIGSLFIVQYVVIFGYCLLAMIRSAANFFMTKERRTTDRTLLMIMLVDTVAVMIQLLFMVNMMNTALLLTVLLSYMTVYSSELEQIRGNLEQARLLSLKQENDYRDLEEINTRFFTLEDKFMSLYDVELESGHYVSFDRDDFYSSTITNKLVPENTFFESLRPNVDRVIFEDDRETAYNFQLKDNIVKGLSGNDHIDNYYRIITENGPMWLRMRIVYKNAEKKNVLIGVFNAEEEMEAKQRDERIKEELFQTNSRLFALEDTFESLYDVELESGRYDSFVKGDFYQRIVIDKLVQPGDYFEDLRANIDAAIYYEDRDGLYNKLTRESIRRELAASDHFDYYYRVNTENEPIWFRMRIVYKDDQKKNVIIGVFNAENDIEAKQLVEQKELLEKDMQMISGLASGYNALYYINIDENVLHIYTLDEEKYPGSKAIFESEESDFYKIIAGYGLSEQVHPDDRFLFENFGAEWIRKKLTGRKKYAMRFRALTDTGYRWDEMELVKYEDTDETANAVAVGFTDRDADIRREQDYQQRLRDARKAADAANQSKSNFLFNMSHDIRTPMNAIRGFTAMAKKNAGDRERVTEYLNKIDISGQQLLTLINQVLEMARIESGKIELEEKPINIREEFNSMVTVLNEQAKSNGLSFTHSLEGIEHNNVLADEARMSSVTLNIVGNAMKYTPSGGTVDFRLKEVPCEKPGYGTYVFTVADTGIGMSKEYIKELYEPFSREKTSTVSKIQGTGLGLSIVKSIIDLMGGTIEVQSEPGKGTQFDITVDFKINENAKADSKENEDREIVSFKGRRVLLVEDNEMNREIARDILEEQGLVVEDAEDGDIAVEMIREIAARGEFHYYDFILMDVQMPRMTGYEATKIIREMPGPDGVHIPIIAITANAFEEDRKNAIAAGMDDHLSKPIDIQKLFRTIAKYL